MQQSSRPKIWYKQFWPWFLIFVPLMSMVLSFTMMNLAFNSEDSMVIDDYYKEGKGINLKLKKIENARALNISASIMISEESIAVKFLSGKPDSGEAMMLDFFHSTQKHKDFSVNLLRDANGSYRAPLDTEVSGKWQISLHPYNGKWKIQKTVILPQGSAFDVYP